MFVCLCSVCAVCKLGLCPGQHPGCFNDPHHLQVLQVALQYMCVGLLHCKVHIDCDSECDLALL